jgi:hypothetical protein
MERNVENRLKEVLLVGALKMRCLCNLSVKPFVKALHDIVRQLVVHTRLGLLDADWGPDSQMVCVAVGVSSLVQTLDGSLEAGQDGGRLARSRQHEFFRHRCWGASFDSNSCLWFIGILVSYHLGNLFIFCFVVVDFRHAGSYWVSGIVMAATVLFAEIKDPEEPADIDIKQLRQAAGVGHKNTLQLCNAILGYRELRAKAMMSILYFPKALSCGCLCASVLARVLILLIRYYAPAEYWSTLLRIDFAATPIFDAHLASMEAYKTIATSIQYQAGRTNMEWAKTEINVVLNLLSDSDKLRALGLRSTYIDSVPSSVDTENTKLFYDLCINMCCTRSWYMMHFVHTAPEHFVGILHDQADVAIERVKDIEFTACLLIDAEAASSSRDHPDRAADSWAMSTTMCTHFSVAT